MELIAVEKTITVKYKSSDIVINKYEEITKIRSLSWVSDQLFVGDHILYQINDLGEIKKIKELSPKDRFYVNKKQFIRGDGHHIEFYELNDDYNLELKKTRFIEYDEFDHIVCNNFIITSGDFNNVVYDCLTDGMYHFDGDIRYVSNDIIAVFNPGKGSKFLDFGEAKVKKLKDCTCYHKVDCCVYPITDDIVEIYDGYYYRVRKNGLEEIEPHASLIIPFSDKYVNTLASHIADTSLTKEIINHVVMKYLL